MQKQIHVNSYVKSDGTQVKEHFRNIDTDKYGKLPPMFPSNPDYSVMDKEKTPPIRNIFGMLSETTGTDFTPVLEGGVSVDVGFPAEGGGIGDILGGLDDVWGTVAAIGLPIALEMLQAANSSSQALEYLKPQFDTKIKQLDTHVAQMKTDIDNKVAKLVNAKNKIEYTKLYEPLQKDWQNYQQAKNFVNRIKTYANNNDFKSVSDELGNFIDKDTYKQTVKNIMSVTNKLFTYKESLSNPNRMTLDERVINSIGRAGSEKMSVAGANLQNAMQNFKYAKDNPHAHILNSRIEITNQGLNKLMDQVGIPKDSRGVIYDNNSEQSKILWQSPEIQDFVNDNLQDLLSDNAKEVYDIEFKVNGNYTGHRFDNYLGLQHCKLYNPQITSDGYFKGIIVDYYDFAKRDYTENILSNALIYVNNWGYSMQEKGFLENIFNIYIMYEKL